MSEVYPTDNKLCLKCQTAGGNLVAKPEKASYLKFLQSADRWAKCKNPEYVKIQKRLEHTTQSELETKGATWHLDCYKETVNKTNLERAEKRYKASVALGKASLIAAPRVGRPSGKKSHDAPQPSTSKPFTRSSGRTEMSSEKEDKECCLFCDEDGTHADLHEVESFKAGKKIREAVDKSNNDKWKVKLQPIDPDDARSIDIKYHRKCYITYVLRGKSDSQQLEEKEQDIKETNERLVAADCEFFSLMKSTLSDGKIKPMNDIFDAYCSLLEEHGVSNITVTKASLKKKIEETLDVEFSRPSKRKPDLVCSQATRHAAVGEAAEKSEFDFEKDIQSVFDCAKIVRKHILKSRENPWLFDGSLTDEHVVPSVLYNLIKWIVGGSHSALNCEFDSNRANILHRLCVNIAQTIMYEVKSSRQMLYKPKSVDHGFKHKATVHENPHVLGVGIKIHSSTRSKHLVQFLHANSVSVDYGRLLRVETQLAEAVIRKMEETNGVYLPADMSKGKMTFFAIDNIDFTEDTVDGKNTLHGTVLVAFQQRGDQDTPVHESMQLETPGVSKSLKNLPSTIVDLLPCPVKGNPKPKSNVKYKRFQVSMTDEALHEPEEKDLTWHIVRSLCRSAIQQHEASSVLLEVTDTEEGNESSADSIKDTDDGAKKRKIHIPAWAGYNSLICKDQQPLTRIHVLPLVASPANEWQTLFTVLKHAQQISAEVVGPEQKTIITLDMDLYMRALKLQMMSQDCGNKWILRIGEFHTVLCALRAVGSSIENSGIDDAWVESGLYSPTTVRQILEGKHMKRALKAHALTVEVLYDLLLEECGLSQLQNRTIGILSDAANSADCELAFEAHQEITHETVNSGLKDNLNAFCKSQSSQNMYKVTKEYMDNFGNILMFIRASREGNWMAHLASLERLCPLFFHQDRLKYAQHVPDYLARMHSLKDTDPGVWKEFISGNFCVKKSRIPFTSIGVDHALEQENRKMKVLGGLKGITQKPETLARFFLIAPELARLSAETSTDMTPQSRKQHHELSKSGIERDFSRIAELKAVLKESNPFQFQGDQLLNIITKSVMPQSVQMDILQREEIGKNAYHSFVKERIQGPVNLWEKMQKLKLKSWKSAVKTTKVVQGNKTIELKEDRSLFARMTIAARTRPDIDIKEAVGMYEFSNISRALFSSDGLLLPCNDKSKLLPVLETLPDKMKEAAQEGEEPAESEGITESVSDESMKPKVETKVIIIDAMMIVQQVAATEKKVKNCKEFAGLFIECLERKFAPYDVMHLVFDHYDVDFSLKQGTRNRRAEKVKESRSYVCMDTTQIRIPMSSFISNTKTKGSLAEYLAAKVLEHFKNGKKTVVVSTQAGAKSYHVDADHLTSCQEEADTLLVLHAVSVAGPDVIIHFLSSDTDVFVLALRRFPDLGTKTCVVLGTGSKQRLVPLRPIYEALGPELAAALPGFHCFTGCDTTGRFAGKGKATCWQALQKASPNVKNAFIQLGKTERPTDEVKAGLEEYVCRLYQPKSKINDVKSLRWEMFRKSQAEAEKLPPTQAVLEQAILRAHYQAMVWCHETEAKPVLPAPESYGWKKEGNMFEPIVTHLKPAPDAVIELISCACGAGKCKGTKCSCRKADMVCTEMCACEAVEESCLNTESIVSQESEDELTDDEDV